MNNYKNRICDQLLRQELAGAGSVVIEEDGFGSKKTKNASKIGMAFAKQDVWDDYVTAGADAHAEVRPIQNVAVRVSEVGLSQAYRLGDKCDRVAVLRQKRLRYRCGTHLRKPRPVPKCRRAIKPKAQKERGLSLFARVDDILNRSQFCVRGSACGKDLFPILSLQPQPLSTKSI